MKTLPEKGSSMLARLGRVMYRHRWKVVVIWMATFGISAVFAPRASGVLQGGGYSIGSSQSIEAYNTLNHAYGYQALLFTAVFTGARASLTPSAHDFRSAVHEQFGNSLSLGPPVWTPDHAVVFIRIYSRPRDDLGAGLAAPLRALMPKGRVRAYLSGTSAIFHDMETVSNEDLRRVEIVTLPIAAVVLLLIFGSVVASSTPVLMAPIAVTLALAVIYFLGQRVSMSIFVLNTTSMLGLGVAIDYSLFMVNRFRQELARGRTLEESVGTTVATAGRAILISALVVTIGFYALTFSGISMLRSLGIGGSIVTSISLCVALTLLPAILGILGHRINYLPVVPRRVTSYHIWRRLSHWVMRRPLAIIGAVVAIIIVLASPSLHLRVGIPGPEILPASAESRAGNDILQQHLGLANRSPVLVVVKRLNATQPSTAGSTAFTVLGRVCRSQLVGAVSTVPIADSPRQLSSCQGALQSLQSSTTANSRLGGLARRHSVGLVSVFLRTEASSAAAEHFVGSLRSDPVVKGYRVLVGGQTAGQMDFDNYLYGRFPLVVLFVVVTIYLVLLIAFRSLLLPLKAVLMNGFSILAAYGAVVFSFQDGHLRGLLGFTPVGNIDAIVPVFLFCVLFGISTDYEVFLLSRVQEEYLASGNNEESVAGGLEYTGRIITSAAAVMIIVFGAFSFAQLVVIKEIGLGLAVGVLVDATLIRALLVPATMRLLGRWNWWLPEPISMVLPAHPRTEAMPAIHPQLYGDRQESA